MEEEKHPIPSETLEKERIKKEEELEQLIREREEEEAEKRLDDTE